MTFAEILENQVALIAVGAIIGIISSFITARLTNRRGVIEYNINYTRLGLTAKDDFYGDLQVTWRGTVLQSVWMANVEIVNRSAKDFTEVVVKLFTLNETRLLSGRFLISDTVDPVLYTDEYEKTIHIPDNTEPTKFQIDAYFHRRHYLLHNFNRGQILTGTYVVDFTSDDPARTEPSIGLSITHPGLRLKHRQRPTVRQTVLGVPIPHAGLVGLLVVLIAWAIAVAVLPSSWYVSFASLIVGAFAAIPGALVVRVGRWLSRVLTG